MPTPISTSALDRILAVQLTVAWAGEERGDPPGLGWWATSLADPEGGGNFLQRMFPRTHVWAALGGMREAARRADAKARAQAVKADKADELITLFHFGFEWDEALQERFELHKRQGVEPHERDAAEAPKPEPHDPASVLGSEFAAGPKLDRAAFEKYLGRLAGKVAHEIVPAGRQIKGPLGTPEEAAVKLAVALLPLVPAYPLPFYPAPEGR